MNHIVCRAQVHDECYDHQPEKEEQPMVEDGTWDGKSIICDACYLEILPFTPVRDYREDLLAGLENYYANRNHVKQHPNPSELVEEAAARAETARVGSPMHRSALAAKAMAEAEVARRESGTSEGF